MPVTFRVRGARALGALGLAAALLAPGAAPAVAQEQLVLRVGTTQDLDSMNPFETILVVGFEAFTLNYDLLVGFGPDLEPIPAYAESWEQSDDGLTWTFKMQQGMTFSDGTPATSADAEFTLQLVLDAINSEAGFLCKGYLDPYLVNAGVTAVDATDATTLTVTTDRPNDQILRSYIPILPKHVWGTFTPATICDQTNETPVIGSGPYQAVEWQTGQSITFDRNEKYWGKQGAADRVVIQVFADGGTMAESIRNGDLDYARGLNAEQFDALSGAANITTVAGTANGFTELGFNTYGTGTGKTIPDGGPSTTALLDPQFRDALGYAVDKETLVDRVIGGYGEAGTTQVPPFQTRWHVPPTTPRTFSIETAKSKLTAAGYNLDSQGRLLDKDLQPISLDLVMPDSDDNYPKVAQFIEDWWGQLGITINSQVFDSGTLTELMLPPEAGEGYKADYDIFIWGWGGDVDPNSLLEIFTCGSIGSSSDSMYCNPAYDALFDAQNASTSESDRKAKIAEMQQIMYNDAPYHIVFYDANTDAYRTDRFGGWQNQPKTGGVPLFVYGSLDYTLLTDASAAPSPSPDASAGASTAPSGGAVVSPGASPSPADGGSTGSGGDNTPLIVGLVAALAAVVAGLVFVNRRRSSAAADEDE